MNECRGLTTDIHSHAGLDILLYMQVPNWWLSSNYDTSMYNQ